MVLCGVKNTFIHISEDLLVTRPRRSASYPPQQWARCVEVDVAAFEKEPLMANQSVLCGRSASIGTTSEDLTLPQSSSDGHFLSTQMFTAATPRMEQQQRTRLNAAAHPWQMPKFDPQAQPREGGSLEQKALTVKFQAVVRSTNLFLSQVTGGSKVKEIRGVAGTWWCLTAYVSMDNVQRTEALDSVKEMLQHFATAQGVAVYSRRQQHFQDTQHGFRVTLGGNANLQTQGCESALPCHLVKVTLEVELLPGVGSSTTASPVTSDTCRVAYSTFLS
eukprot:CAMPEP_0172679296 /NCGR_PEP_ID=MMETSP1074-20121228/15968_1 /TAXON_ID=2916 /ORGANISM="Ceratium fusus, Strain PA161109" /LENGTH=275 /DNA_ID=CAMNT_0013497447 /DNA_START=12 /DNA_END=836 /DNA_ORIENTATION=+